ncbi:hypothetical protein EYF80_008627 [Liparis tanakae]|uniref:Uncharacterized protein n=1 Tax=Liparis tanakae TaxID=230148 RepID=A0A4Z2IT17_9TELE|nr:hypothetical protein EYF80_008627 [Liparis tanakae]
MSASSWPLLSTLPLILALSAKEQSVSIRLLKDNRLVLELGNDLPIGYTRQLYARLDCTCEKHLRYSFSGPEQRTT